MNTLRLSIIVAVASVIHVAHAAPTIRDESTGVQFASSLSVEGTRYQCLGAGVRKVLFFKAYAVTYCLQASQAQSLVDGYIQKNHPGLKGEKLQDALEDDPRFFRALADASGDKLVIMRLVRNISKNQIADAFRSSLSEVLPKEKVEKLIATIPGDAKDGQKIQLYSKGSELVIDIAGDARRIDDAEIAQKLWLVWLGPDTPTPSLKDSIAKHAASSFGATPAPASPSTNAAETKTPSPNEEKAATTDPSEEGETND